MRFVADHDLGMEFLADRGAIATREVAACVLDDDAVAAGASRPRIAGGEIAEASREPGGHFAPSDVAGSELFIGCTAAGKPEAELRPLLEHRIAGSLHRSREWQDIGVGIEPGELRVVGDDQDIGIVALAQDLAERGVIAGRGRGAKVSTGLPARSPGNRNRPGVQSDQPLARAA